MPRLEVIAARSLNGLSATIKRNPDAGRVAGEKIAHKLTGAVDALERFTDWLTEVGNRKL